ncbi:MAG: hypothetical protein IJ240_01780 [Clostridia bacterium]|nr:hypothetical protein [Clostridia bacterium]
MKKKALWTVIHMTRGQEKADMILAALQAEGFMARSTRMSRVMSDTEDDFEILVIASEAEEAQQFLIERGLLL